MDYPKITRLYKYASWSDRTASTLASGKLWFALPHSFNDPYDCTLPNHAFVHLQQRKTQALRHRKSGERLQRLGPTPDIGSLLRAINERFLTHVSNDDMAIAAKFVEGHNTIQSFLHTFGVLSLSATPRSILMWSHYAHQHAGICFEFERSPSDKLGLDAKPVIYSMRREGDKLLDSHPHASPLFLKYSGWRYEREWRLLENNGGRMYDFPAKLLSIICGARMPESDLAAVKAAVATFNSSRRETVIVKRAQMSPLTYSLSIRPL
ncbi:MAG: DUF2971 domain-containing protein [Ideonella sp.]|nr:DUF2971 domain-containing protein [Ideonella sp.]